MKRRFGILAFLLLGASAAQAASCGSEIDKVQAQVDARLEAIAAASPGAAETRAARLHRQPTPASIAAAERGLRGDARARHALADLKKARRAEAHGDAKACARAVAEARAALAPR